MQGPSKDDVSNLVKVVMGTSMRVGLPHAFEFCGDRLYFLATASKSPSSSLQYLDITQDGTSGDLSNLPSVEYQSLFGSQQLPHQQQLSKEEQMLRERLRLVEQGVTSFFIEPTSTRILVPQSGQLLIARGTEVHSVASGDTMMDPKWSADGHLISYIHDSDIWLVDPVTGVKRRVTTLHGKLFWSVVLHGKMVFIDHTLELGNHKSAGESKFVMQEEFDRYTGYWWSPTVAIDNTGVTRHTHSHSLKCRSHCPREASL